MQNTFTFKVNAFNERIKLQLHSQPTFHLYNHLHRHLYVNTETIERRKTKLKRNIIERKRRRKQRITIYIIDLKKTRGNKERKEAQKKQDKKVSKIRVVFGKRKTCIVTYKQKRISKAKLLKHLFTDC